MKIAAFLAHVALVMAPILFLVPACTDKEIAENTENPLSPEEELAHFTLTEGFVAELVASEKDGVIKPIDITFDDAGRLWTQTASMYPMDPIMDIKWNDLLELMNDKDKQKNHPAFKRVLDLYQGRTKGDDKILILSDIYGNSGVKTAVWADHLALPMSILPYRNGAYVAQGSELFFLDDADKNGKADERKPLFTGFGFTDSHTMAHLLTRGPGGWIYFSQGGLNKGEVVSLQNDLKLTIDYSKIVRFTGDGRNIELVNSGLNNIWGYQLRSNGQWYASEANDLGYSVVPLDGGMGFGGIGNDRLREYQPFVPPLHKFRVGGTGLSGLAFSDNLGESSFPSEWKNVALLANPITSSINAVRVVRNPDGTVSSEHLPDLLTSKDKFFRPVNMEIGPDGCLYVADWYNKIISHNEVPTSHPDRDKSRGRIWRIRHKNQKPAEVPDFTKMPTGDLIAHLESPILWAKRAAWHQIIDRPSEETKSLIPALVKIVGDDSKDEPTRIHALWCLEGLQHYDEDLITALLTSDKDNIHREAIRALASFPLDVAKIGVMLKNDIEHSNPLIRSQVIRTLGDLHKADTSTISILLRACKADLPGNEMGGSYERKHERFLALLTLEQYPSQLSAYLNSNMAESVPVINRIWALQALPKNEKEKLFLQLWPKSGITKLDEPTFIQVAQMVDNPQIAKLVEPRIADTAFASEYVGIATANKHRLTSAALPGMLKNGAVRLLKSDKETDRQLALEAIGALGIRVPGESIAAEISDGSSDYTVRLALAALTNDPGKHIATFVNAAKNPAFSFELRALALNSLAKTAPVKAMQIITEDLASYSTDHRKLLVSTLAGSDEGSALAIQLYDQKLVDAASFEFSMAERISKTYPGNPVAAGILEDVKNHLELEKRAFQAKLQKYMAIADKKDGDPAKGEVLFQTCLMCHRVGDKGQDIAPALDGSASRDNESLLTALLDPNAAVERGYAVYRITRKDNTSVEGYLYERDGNGTTIALMGGNKVFVRLDDIKAASFLSDGRSFMPRGLIDNLSDEQVANLLAYIRTLE